MAPLPDLTLTIDYTLAQPPMVFSEAWGDVHIITYNGLHYDFQAVGGFTLAQSVIPDDSFDIQLRLQPCFNGASVAVIEAGLQPRSAMIASPLLLIEK